MAKNYSEIIDCLTGAIVMDEDMPPEVRRAVQTLAVYCSLKDGDLVRETENSGWARGNRRGGEGPLATVVEVSRTRPPGCSLAEDGMLWKVSVLRKL
jgi:GT2 family glycosyltransferase